MAATINQQRFSEYYELADKLMDLCEKDALAEVARILAMHIAFYQAKYGKLLLADKVALLKSETMTVEELGIAADGMEYLTAVVGAAAGLTGDEPVQ